MPKRRKSYRPGRCTSRRCARRRRLGGRSAGDRDHGHSPARREELAYPQREDLGKREGRRRLLGEGAARWLRHRAAPLVGVGAQEYGDEHASSDATTGLRLGTEGSTQRTPCPAWRGGSDEQEKRVDHTAAKLLDTEHGDGVGEEGGYTGRHAKGEVKVHSGGHVQGGWAEEAGRHARAGWHRERAEHAHGGWDGVSTGAEAGSTAGAETGVTTGAQTGTRSEAEAGASGVLPQTGAEESYLALLAAGGTLVLAGAGS